jgi:hypothetical protein
VKHPIGQGHAITVAATRGGARPGRDGAKQERSRDGESQNNAAGPRPLDRRVGIGDGRIDATIGIRTGKTCHRGHQLTEVGAVIRRNTAM